MKLATAFGKLLELWGEIYDLETAEELLEWDQETMLPAKGVGSRAKVMATLATLRHQRMTSPQLEEALSSVLEQARPGSLEAAQAAEADRLTRRARRIPVALAAALAEGRSVALAAWQQARAESDFGRFAPHLARLLELKKEEARAVSEGGLAYDALLDLYERGSTVAQLEPLLAELRRELTPLVQAVAGSSPPAESDFAGPFPYDAQRRLALELIEAVGFDGEAGRLDLSTHPFCIGIAAGDVRLTWRWQEDDFRPALFGVLHEAGHGLYEQGLPAEWERTPLGAAVSLGIHESQSRLWENHVGRSRPFLRWLLPRLRQAFPSFVGIRVDRLWQALHRVEPSLIRTEADEVTYNLHVLVRFEIERAIFAGDLPVAEIPERWDSLYEEVLGIRPPDAASGALQDIHWAQGSFGYFPTYTLGTLAAAQLYKAAERDLGQLEDDLAQGRFGPLLGWLRTKIHGHGARLSPAELIEEATGKPLSARDFLDYVSSTTEEVYGVRV